MKQLIEKPISILLIEDNPGDAGLIREALVSPFPSSSAVEWVTTLADGLAYMEQHTPDAILLDLSLPDSHGLDTLLRVTGTATRVPVIVMTGLHDQSMAVRSLREGAQDYLIKGECDTHLLFRAIRYAMERKDSEAALKHSEEQLQQAQRMEAVGRLAGGIAHDFNNLLTVIDGYSRLLLDAMDQNHPHHKDVTAIFKAAERAATLTRQLLAFGRKQVLQPRVIDLSAVVRDMEQMLRRTIGENIELIVMSASDLGRVNADPGQVEQVIMNLAINARDAMPLGGKLIVECDNMFLDPNWVGKHQEVEPGEYVQLAVTDTGSGMPERVKQQIFDPFFTTKPFGKGTGLGLSTVYGIVRQSGGHIWVYSEPDSGTTIKVHLPRVSDGSAVAESPRKRHRDVTGTERLLVVEDEPELLSMLETFLTKMGYTPLPASNGQDAENVLKAATTPVDLLVSDVVLPDHSGPQIHEALRRIQPGLKALFMSAYPGDSIIQRGVLDPGTPFISKPFSPQALGQKIREVLEAQTPRT